MVANAVMFYTVANTTNVLNQLSAEEVKYSIEIYRFYQRIIEKILTVMAFSSYLGHDRQYHWNFSIYRH